jgi:hypothetical protein
MGHVGIVARVFDNAGRRGIPIPALHGEREGRPFPPWQRDLDRIEKLAREKRRIGGLGSRGRAGTGGPASAQRAAGRSSWGFVFVAGHASAPFAR